MSNRLAQAIDDLLAFLGARTSINNSELAQFKALALTVWKLAHQCGLDRALPKQDEVERPMSSPGLPAVQFEGKVNLPGDWLDASGGFMHGLTPTHERRFWFVADAGWKDDMIALRALAAEKSEPPAGSMAMAHLAVSVERRTVTLEGQTFDVSSVQAVRWLKVLSDHPGEWLSAADLKRFDPDLDGARTDRLRKHLPPPIQSLIDSETGKGSRLRSA